MIRKLTSALFVACLAVALTGCDQAKEAATDAAGGAEAMAEKGKEMVDSAGSAAKDKAAEIVPEGMKDAADGAVDKGADAAKAGIDKATGAAE